LHRDRAIEPSRAFVELGSRLSRDTFLYTFGTSLTLPVSVLTTAFLTRHFTTGDFGQLAVLFASAGLLTVVLNFVFLQGALLLVFVNADVGVELDWSTAEVAERNERPTVLTTGLALTALIGGTVTLAIWAFSPQLSQLLLNNHTHGGAVTLAGLSAASGAIFRYVSNVTRFERRPSTYSTAAAARPLVALAATVPLVLLGTGLSAPLIGTAAGSLVASAFALTVSRRSYGLKMTWRATRRAFRVGLPWIPVVSGLFIAHSADLLFLRTTASNSELGVYRIADGLSSIISYAVSAFHLAQVPLEGTLTVQSAYQEHTRDRVMATYVLGYLITAFALLLLLTLGGGIAVAIIAPGYDKSVPLIPITSLAYVGYGFLLVCFRAGDYYHNRVRAYALTASAAGILVTVLALVLLHVIGVGGAPTGAAIGCFATAIALLALGHRAKHPLPLDYRRVFGVVALATACWALGTQVGTGHDVIGVAARLAALAGYPLGLVMFRIIPRDITLQMPRMLRGILPRRRTSFPLIDRLAALPPAQHAALVAAALERLGPAAGALRLGVSEKSYLNAIAGGLRRLAGGGGEFLLDDDLARYLISDVPPADRDEMLRELHHRSVNMLEFRAMERIYLQLRAIPRSGWNEALMSRYDRPRALAPGDGPTGIVGALDAAGWDPVAAARATGVAEDDIPRELVAQLRALAGSGPAGPADQLIGRFLIDPAAVPSGQLWSAGVDPVELHRLDLVLDAVRGPRVQV
jgi:O-antigen/teichoic acid export membrane protein